MLKKLLLKSSKYLLFLFLGFIGGATGFFLFSIPYRKLKLSMGSQVTLQIDPINLLSLIVTTCLALYILRSLNRKDEGDRVERNLLIEYFGKFENTFTDEVHAMMVSGGVEGEVVAATFKKCGISLQELTDLAKSHPSKDEKGLLALEKAVSEVRELLSNTPAAGQIEDGVRVEGARILYSPRHLSEVTAAMGKFRKAVFSVIISVNRS